MANAVESTAPVETSAEEPRVIRYQSDRTAYAHECLWCGRVLGEEGICQNLECEAYPQGESLHSHLEDKKVCLDVWCHDNHGYMDIQSQRACWYCEYTADGEGICDDDECPAHITEFNPPEPDPDNPSDSGDRITPNHWLVRDGLVNEDGSLTAIGQQCEGWIAQRIEELEESDDGEDEDDE